MHHFRHSDLESPIKQAPAPTNHCSQFFYYRILCSNNRSDSNRIICQSLRRAPLVMQQQLPQKETISLHGDIYKPVLRCANLNTFKSADVICWCSHRRVNVIRLVVSSRSPPVLITANLKRRWTSKRRNVWWLSAGVDGGGKCDSARMMQQ